MTLFRFWCVKSFSFLGFAWNCWEFDNRVYFLSGLEVSENFGFFMYWDFIFWDFYSRFLTLSRSCEFRVSLGKNKGSSNIFISWWIPFFTMMQSILLNDFEWLTNKQCLWFFFFFFSLLIRNIKLLGIFKVMRKYRASLAKLELENCFKRIDEKGLILLVNLFAMLLWEEMLFFRQFKAISYLKMKNLNNVCRKTWTFQEICFKGESGRIWACH